MTTFYTRNPATGELMRSYDLHSQQEVEERTQRVYDAWRQLRDITLEERAVMLGRLAKHFDENVDRYAALVTEEMGRPLIEARQEILKCAVTCRTVAERGVEWLQPLVVETEVRTSAVRFEGLGPILAVMPWNFPFFQVIRFFAPAFLAGNTALGSRWDVAQSACRTLGRRRAHRGPSHSQRDVYRKRRGGTSRRGTGRCSRQEVGA
jgi:acyl-CoA reductase-like NAD-dependent aldehyde dehydrogenase